jgi:hypothetical protein
MIACLTAFSNAALLLPSSAVVVLREKMAGAIERSLRVRLAQARDACDSSERVEGTRIVEPFEHAHACGLAALAGSRTSAIRTRRRSANVLAAPSTSSAARSSIDSFMSGIGR